MTLILSGTDGLSDVDGSAATPAIRGTDTNTGIFFPAADTIAFSEGGVESMRLDSSGNLGIGTSSPARRLDVRGGLGMQVNEDGAGTKVITLRSDFAGAGPAVNVTTNDPLLFLTNNTERARIDTSGRLIVGATTTVGPSKLFSYFSGSVDYGLGLQDSTTTSGTGFIGFFNSAGATIGNIVRNGTTNAVLYNTSSDYRLKEQVRPIPNGLQRVLALKPSAWVWKDCDGQVGEGFIAHEVQAVVSGCVSGEKDAVDAEGNPAYQGMDSSYLVATLTAAIQEQQALIQSLTARIAALEAKE
jgi:hypothetical protein